VLRRFGSALEFARGSAPSSLEDGLTDVDDESNLQATQRSLLESPPALAGNHAGAAPSLLSAHATVTLSRRTVALLGSLTLLLFLLVLWRSSGASYEAAALPLVHTGAMGGAGGADDVGGAPGAGLGFTGLGRVTGDKSVFRIGVVTDLDFASKVDQGLGQSYWKSFYREATLTRDAQTGRYSVLFDADKSQTVLRTRLNLDDRGMELSWLASFGGVLYAGDDRAGVVYSIENGHASARFVLADGDGRAEKGFKSEWAAVKDGSLYVGSFGKEWSNEKGEFINNNPQWVKVIDRHGGVTHVDWTRNYEALRRATGHSFPGYLFHEAAAWNPALQRWVFVPRRASTERYDAELDEVRGANLIIVADASFTDIQVHKVNTDMPLDGVQPKGFSDIKFVPGHPRDIIALRSMEHKGQTKSWISVFNIDGVVLMEDVYIDAHKFEGIEFLPPN
jgi:soluble calcium-activated nucleotidase 1